MSDNGPQTQTNAIQYNGGYSSPQLKPQHMAGYSRKRFKTVTTSNYQLEAQKSSPSCKTNEEENDDFENQLEEEDDDEDDEESGNDTDSNAGSVESGKKRGKYKIYTEEEKAKILNFMMKHGIQKTLEIFSSNTHKITKRKLKSWMESTTKIKGIKGRKTNDPNRDQALYEWCMGFQKDYGRAPTRKEATKKALELSADSSFQASKGWLDKFSKKYNYEFTPLKIIPPKKKTGDRFMEGSDSGSATSNHSSDFEGLSPLMLQSMQPPQSGSKLQAKPWSLDNGSMPQEMHSDSVDMNGIKVSSFFNFSTKSTSMDISNAPSLEQNGFQQPMSAGLMGGNMGGNNFMNHNQNHNGGNQHQHQHNQYQQQQPQQFNLGLPLNYPGYYPSMNYDMKNEGGYQMGFHLNSQINSDINSFLNTTAGNHENHHHHNHGGYGGNNNQMKLEYPY